MHSSKYTKTIEMKPLVGNGKLIDDFIGRIEPAKDSFFAFYNNPGSFVFDEGDLSQDDSLIEFFIKWMSIARRSYSFIGGTRHTQLDWKLGFGPVAPFAFIAIAEEFYGDPDVTLQFAERRADGSVNIVRCRPPSLQPFTPDGDDRRPDPNWLHWEDRWPVGHIMMPDAEDDSTDY